MAVLTTKKRNSLAPAVFALPGGRFPIPDANHARAALSGASRALNAGNITPTQKQTVVAKAKRKLAK